MYILTCVYSISNYPFGGLVIHKKGKGKGRKIEQGRIMIIITSMHIYPCIGKLYIWYTYI